MKPLANLLENTPSNFSTSLAGLPNNYEFSNLDKLRLNSELPNLCSVVFFYKVP
jgi:hypothetical protein